MVLGGSLYGFPGVCLRCNSGAAAALHLPRALVLARVSVLTALAIGLVPPGMIPVPGTWGVARDITIGFVFIFLIVWGGGAPLFRRHHQTPHPKPQG